VSDQSDDLDLIWGAAAIARMIGKTTRATLHILEKGQLPAVKKVGIQYVASRKALREFFDGTAAKQ
jgi:hypothetical protein